MHKKSYFVNEAEMRQYHIQNVEIDIEVNPDVFPPPKNNPITSQSNSGSAALIIDSEIDN